MMQQRGGMCNDNGFSGVWLFRLGQAGGHVLPVFRRLTSCASHLFHHHQ